jgi:lipoyl-dependent peroxiredoxin
MADRRAEASWEGTLTEGRGIVELVSSEAASLPVTWASRVESPDGRTSPEELIAAAHASCFSMALSHGLTGAGTPPERLQTASTVSIEPKEGGGFHITRSRIEVRGVVPGIDQAAFDEAAQAAGQGCPVSGALAGNIEIDVSATLQE